MYQTYYPRQNYGQVQNQGFNSTQNYNQVQNQNGDRFLGALAFPFLLGGVTGAALAPAFWNRPPYGGNYYYYPYPPYQYNNYYYPPYYYRR